MGGESLTKMSGTTNVPEEAMDNIDLGTFNSVSIETIISLEPDLVLMTANVSSNEEMAKSLEEMGIETMLVDTSDNAYQRFKENAYLFSKVLGNDDTYEEKITPIVEKVDEIIAKAEEIEDKPKVAAIFATSKSLSLESEGALTGEMISLLGGKNILKEEDILAEGETRVDFSIEALIAQNPDIIMFSTMGDIDKAKETINTMISENPVWEEVEAVKNNRVYYLPKEFSVYKPNERYDEAFQYIANLLYPDQFKEE
jgi:iron complex transport system substrate-binding protein